VKYFVEVFSWSGLIDRRLTFEELHSLNAVPKENYFFSIKCIEKEVTLEVYKHLQKLKTNKTETAERFRFILSIRVEPETARKIESSCTFALDKYGCIMIEWDWKKIFGFLEEAEKDEDEEEKDDEDYTYWEYSGWRARYLPNREGGVQYLLREGDWLTVKDFSFTEETRLLEIEVGLERPISIQICLGGLEALQNLLYDEEGEEVMGGLGYDCELSPYTEEAQFEGFKLRLTKAGKILVWQDGQTVEPTWRQVEKVGDKDGKKGIFAYLNCFFPLGEDHLVVLSWIMERSGDLCHV